MKHLDFLRGGEYTAPTLEVLDIAVEQGFASSPVFGGEGEPGIDPEDFNGFEF